MFAVGDMVVYASDGWDGIHSGRIGQVGRIIRIDESYDQERTGANILLSFGTNGGPFGETTWWSGTKFVTKGKLLNRRR